MCVCGLTQFVTDTCLDERHHQKTAVLVFDPNSPSAPGGAVWGQEVWSQR